MPFNSLNVVWVVWVIALAYNVVIGFEQKVTRNGRSRHIARYQGGGGMSERRLVGKTVIFSPVDPTYAWSSERMCPCAPVARMWCVR